MSPRKAPLVNGEIYHVFNRGTSLQPTFFNNRDYQRLLNAMIYYRNIELPMKLSLFLTVAGDKRNEFINKASEKANFWVEIISFCFMPNHIHFLLRQIEDNGISRFIGKMTNSYTRYLNTKQKRSGPFFQGRFKAVRIENSEQLLHCSRYIHLNPLTSYVVKNEIELENYSYSSFPEYLGKIKKEICQKKIILDQFKSISTYKKFVLDQADYQRELELIKHLVME